MLKILKSLVQDETTGTEAGGGAPSTPAPAPKAKPKKAAKPKAKKAAPKKKSGKSGATKGVKGPQVLKQYAPQYRKGGKSGDQKTAGGNKAIDCGDKVADMFAGMDLDEVYAKAVPILNKAQEEGDTPWTVASLKKKYSGLNVGMQRMNVGNRVRSALGLSKSGKK